MAKPKQIISFTFLNYKTEATAGNILSRDYNPQGFLSINLN